jgi:hypothetical protein
VISPSVTPRLLPMLAANMSEPVWLGMFTVSPVWITILRRQPNSEIPGKCENVQENKKCNRYYYLRGGIVGLRDDSNEHD